jgi:MiaB/RimO family radical SAM methylthiotransferase
MKRVYIYNQGCNNRALDANRIRDYFLLNKYSPTDEPSLADIVILVTCAYSKAKEDEAIKLIISYQKYRKKIIVAGCLGGVNRERLEKKFKGPAIMPKNMNAIDEFFPENIIKFGEIRDANCPYNCSYLERDWFYIRISEGCLGRCSYCGVRNAIGRLRSKSYDDCLKEFEEGFKKGYRKFAIVSEDTGSYGLDIGLTFPKLLRELVARNGNSQLIIHPGNPKWYVFYLEDLIPIIKSGRIKSLLIPIQSGSERILKLMNRFSDIRRVRSSIRKLKRAFPNMVLATHILVGFPSETEEDFRDTLRAVKEIGFNFIGIVPYSERPNTESVNIFPKVSREEIIARVNKAESFLINNKIYFLHKNIS